MIFNCCSKLIQIVIRVESSLQLIDFGKSIDLELESDQTSNTETSSGGRQGKYHLDYFGIAGSAYCLLFGKYIEVSTSKNRWVVKGTFRRWWQVKVTNNCIYTYVCKIYLLDVESVF